MALNSSSNREFRLSPSGSGRGVSCDMNGAFVGTIPLLKRSRVHGTERWEPLDCDDLSKQIGKQFGLPIDFSSKAGGLKAISNALNEGNVARAQVAAVLLGIYHRNLQSLRGHVFRCDLHGGCLSFCFLFQPAFRRKSFVEREPANHGSQFGAMNMKLENVGTVIAERELSLDGIQNVRVLIGMPKQQAGDDNWYCPYQADGIGSGRIGISYGVDPVQALVLALSMVGAELYCSSEYEAGRLSWDCGAVKGDLGFPVPESIRDVLPHHQTGEGSR